MAKVKPFWIAVCGLLAAACAILYIEASRGWDRTDLMQRVRADHEWMIARHLLAAIMLSAVWAICFRPQLETGRLSLFAMFSLVTIQAAGLWLVRIMDLL
jgi:hypothetical protein